MIVCRECIHVGVCSVRQQMNDRVVFAFPDGKEALVDVPNAPLLSCDHYDSGGAAADDYSKLVEAAEAQELQAQPTPPPPPPPQPPQPQPQPAVGVGAEDFITGAVEFGQDQEPVREPVSPDNKLLDSLPEGSIVEQKDKVPPGYSKLGSRRIRLRGLGNLGG